MKKHIESYVKNCAVCAAMKKRPGKSPGLLQQVTEPTRPSEEIAMDFIVELPESGENTVIWTAIDLFSKQVLFIACSNLLSAQKLAVSATHLLAARGAEANYLRPRGSVYHKTLEGINKTDHPKGLARLSIRARMFAESATAMIEQYLRCYVNYQQSNWADLLPFAEVAYNNAVPSSKGLTPFKVATGVEFVPMPEYPREPPPSVSLSGWVGSLQKAWGNVKKALKQPREIQPEKRRASQGPFHIGDKVYLSTKYLKLRLPCKKLWSFLISRLFPLGALCDLPHDVPALLIYQTMLPFAYLIYCKYIYLYKTGSCQLP